MFSFYKVHEVNVRKRVCVYVSVRFISETYRISINLGIGFALDTVEGFNSDFHELYINPTLHERTW
jgi:hypothetical protein